MTPEENNRLSLLEGWRKTLDFGHSIRILKDIKIPFNKIIGFIYAGSVDSSGTAVKLPPGWTSATTGTGVYTVTHNLGTINYVAVATVVSGINSRAISVSIAATILTITIGNATNSAGENNAFNFIVIKM